jgi:hypothetical protein
MYSKTAKIDPIQYDPEFPYKYNNFVYRITLSSVPSIVVNNGRQPGTVPIPDGTKDFVMRLTNPDAEDMHVSTRVENEVAMISLAAAALQSFNPHVVPSVYGWASAAPPSQQGWILQELMPGATIDETFDGMSLQEKKGILSQTAGFLKALQEFQIPRSIEKYGGVTFDASGQIVSAALPSVGSGPWQSYEDYFRDRLERALQRADSSPYIKGWHANGVRKRLDAFVAGGVSAQFEALKSKDGRSIVHADFGKFRSLLPRKFVLYG